MLPISPAAHTYNIIDDLHFILSNITDAITDEKDVKEILQLIDLAHSELWSAGAFIEDNPAKFYERYPDSRVSNTHNEHEEAHP